MHFVVADTYGPTNPTRAMPPSIFAASAIQARDRVTIMLFHDAVSMAVQGAGAKPVPVGPPNRHQEVVAHANVKVWVCKPCAEVRGLSAAQLDARITLGGMNDFHAASKQPDTQVVGF